SELTTRLSQTGANKSFGAIIRGISDNIIRTPVGIEEVDAGLTIATIVEIGTHDFVAVHLQDFGHSAIAASALPNLALKLFIIGEGVGGPGRRGKIIGAVEVRETL